MLNPPKTLEEAQKIRYGANAYNSGDAYDSLQCAYEVYGKGRWVDYHQCHRKNGYGVGKLYCKQHAKEIK